MERTKYCTCGHERYSHRSEAMGPIRMGKDGTPKALNLGNETPVTCWQWRTCGCEGWENSDGKREAAEDEARRCGSTKTKTGKPCRKPSYIWSSDTPKHCALHEETRRPDRFGRYPG